MGRVLKTQPSAIRLIIASPAGWWKQGVLAGRTRR